MLKGPSSARIPGLRDQEQRWRQAETAEEVEPSLPGACVCQRSSCGLGVGEGRGGEPGRPAVYGPGQTCAAGALPAGSVLSGHFCKALSSRKSVEVPLPAPWPPGQNPKSGRGKPRFREAEPQVREAEPQVQGGGAPSAGRRNAKSREGGNHHDFATRPLLLLGCSPLPWDFIRLSYPLSLNCGSELVSGGIVRVLGFLPRVTGTHPPKNSFGPKATPRCLWEPRLGPSRSIPRGYQKGLRGLWRKGSLSCATQVGACSSSFKAPSLTPGHRPRAPSNWTDRHRLLQPCAGRVSAGSCAAHLHHVHEDRLRTTSLHNIAIKRKGPCASTTVPGVALGASANRLRDVGIRFTFHLLSHPFVGVLWKSVGRGYPRRVFAEPAARGGRGGDLSCPPRGLRGQQLAGGSVDVTLRFRDGVRAVCSRDVFKSLRVCLF